MAGIEPASERLSPRTSTSVVACFSSLSCPQATQGHAQPAAGTRKPRLGTLSGLVHRTLALCRPSRLRPESGSERTRPLRADLRSGAHCTRQREEEQHIQCGWHLKVCADFSSSAPLGSQSGTSLFRRSLSSPVKVLYHQAHPRAGHWLTFSPMIYFNSMSNFSPEAGLC